MGYIARIWDNSVLQGVLNCRLVQFCDENTEENRLEQQNKVYFFLARLTARNQTHLDTNSFKYSVFRVEFLHVGFFSTEKA